MIGCLPKSLKIGEVSYPIRSDYRVALTIFDALENPDLKPISKRFIMMDAIYPTLKEIPQKYMQEAVDKAVWFLDGGKQFDNVPKQKKVMDWEQDEQYIFSSFNSVAGHEVRNDEYMHWWTFLGYFYEIREGLFSTIVNIRQKKATGKKLEKYEQDFYAKNKNLKKIKKKYSKEEIEERNEIEELLK